MIDRRIVSQRIAELQVQASTARLHAGFQRRWGLHADADESELLARNLNREALRLGETTNG